MKSSNKGREKRAKRKEVIHNQQQVLEKKKAVDELLKSASLNKDHLASFRPFCRYDRNGLFLYLESGSGDKLSSSVKQYIQNLLKVNMEAAFGPEWPMEEKVKRRDMVSSNAHYIFVRDGVCDGANEVPPLVGFVHFRFTLEEQLPVLYVYEIQLESRVQGKGMGKFLMQLLELIAHKCYMSAVVLTVQKANTAAMNFYTSKLRYTISRISPSKVDPLMGVEKNYEILCKALNHEAKTILEIRPFTNAWQLPDGDFIKGTRDDVAHGTCATCLLWFRK